MIMLGTSLRLFTWNNIVVRKVKECEIDVFQQKYDICKLILSVNVKTRKHSV